MRERLERRLEELRAEFEKGEQTLRDLETQAANVRQMLLRISGAVQVLEEELDGKHEIRKESAELSGQANGGIAAREQAVGEAGLRLTAER
jgi:predicted nuclease with TOPRIM domain